MGFHAAQPYRRASTISYFSIRVALPLSDPDVLTCYADGDILSNLVWISSKLSHRGKLSQLTRDIEGQIPHYYITTSPLSTSSRRKKHHKKCYYQAEIKGKNGQMGTYGIENISVFEYKILILQQIQYYEQHLNAPATITTYALPFVLAPDADHIRG